MNINSDLEINPSGRFLGVNDYDYDSSSSLSPDSLYPNRNLNIRDPRVLEERMLQVQDLMQRQQQQKQDTNNPSNTSPSPSLAPYSRMSRARTIDEQKIAFDRNRNHNQKNNGLPYIQFSSMQITDPNQTLRQEQEQQEMQDQIIIPTYDAEPDTSLLRRLLENPIFFPILGTAIVGICGAALIIYKAKNGESIFPKPPEDLGEGNNNNNNNNNNKQDELNIDDDDDDFDESEFDKELKELE